MANERILNTRIQLKYDSYSEWTSKNPTLLAGEIAIAKLVNDVTVPVDEQKNAPVLFKVGPGTFNSLPWASALAADVYDWAKQSENDFVNTFLALKMTDGTTVQSKLDAVFATDQQLADAIAEVREEITELSVSALEARVKAIEDDYLKAADIANMATDAEVEAAIKVETDRATQAEEALGLRIDGVKATADAAVTDTKLASTLEPYAKTADVVTNDEFTAFETTNTEEINAAKKAGDDAAALAGTKLDASTYATDKEALEAEDAAIRAIAEATKDRVDTFLDSEEVAGTVDTLKEIQDELERLGGAVELETQFAAKADKVIGATANNFAGLDVNGNLIDSGKKAADFAPADIDTGVHAVALTSGTNNGTVKLTVDGTDTDNIAITGLGSAAFTEASAYEVAGAAAAAQQAAESKVTELAEGAVAINTQNITDIKTVLDTHGDIVTHNAAEFATAAQGALADTALQDADVHALGKSGDLYDSVNVGTAKDTAGEDVPCFVFYCGTASDLV